MACRLHLRPVKISTTVYMLRGAFLGNGALLAAPLNGNMGEQQERP